MKTKQEQIEQIEKVLKNSVADYKRLKKKGVCYCYAETLIDNGYGDVSEYKAEIERLRTTLGQCNTELNSALGSLKSQCREIGELKAKIKQAQIDVLKRLKVFSEPYPNSWGIYVIDVYHIDELIKEIRAQ
jgi:hypothetical protein